MAAECGSRTGRRPIDVPAGERRRWTTTIRPLRRTELRAGRVTVRSVGPLGLAARQGNHEVPWSLRVLPAFPSRRYLPEKLAKLRILDGRTAARVRGQGTEFDSLRDYVEGDDARSIDWRATARRSAVVVRTWRPERDRRIVLVLDTGRTSAARVGSAPRLDAALDAALLLGTLASRAGDKVDLIAVDDRPRVLSRTGRKHGDPLSGLLECDGRVASALGRNRRSPVGRRSAAAGAAAGAHRVVHHARRSRDHRRFVAGAAVVDPQARRAARVGFRPAGARDGGRARRLARRSTTPLRPSGRRLRTAG